MLRILIVDDSKSVHAFLKSLFLKSDGISAKGVYDGRQALDLLSKNSDHEKHSDYQFDLILLDWEMPNLNGIDTLREMKARNITIPIVMMTTKNDPEDIARALQLGAIEYMMKPFTIEILFEKLSRVLDRDIPYAA